MCNFQSQLKQRILKTNCKIKGGTIILLKIILIFFDQKNRVKEETTRKKYVKTWLNFINAHGITRDNEPVEEDFLDWFANRKSIGMTLSTLKCEYSHLNLVNIVQLIFYSKMISFILI